jgi:mono/diheme cytochrome c family protein
MSAQTPRTAGLVILLALVITVLSLIGTASALVNIPNLRLTQTPHAALSTPENTSDIESRASAADFTRGDKLFTMYGCAGCHGLENGAGPYVAGLGARAATRREGYSPATYLYESITNPNALVVTGYPAGVMPQHFKTALPEQDLYDIIAWLLRQ